MYNILKIYEKHKVYKLRNEDNIKKIQEVSFLGKETSSIWIFLSKSDGQHFEPLLEKIVDSVNLSVKDVRIITLDDNQNGIRDVGLYIQSHTPEKIFSFGIQPDQLGMQIEYNMYTVITYLKVEWLFANSLAECNEDRALKVKLWNVMKSWLNS